MCNFFVLHPFGRSSCTKGCAACCNQLIPISAAEVYYLKRQIKLLTNAQQKRIRLRFIQIHKALENCLQHPNHAKMNFEQKYFELKQACPFTENGACCIYQQRPLVCREYHVGSSPSLCDNPYSEYLLDLPIQFYTEVKT